MPNTVESWPRSGCEHSPLACSIQIAETCKGDRNSSVKSRVESHAIAYNPY